MTVEMVWRVGMFSGSGVSMMAFVKVTTKHPRRLGDPERLPMSDVEASIPWGRCAMKVTRRGSFL
jgi:hypothetical protein